MKGAWSTPGKVLFLVLLVSTCGLQSVLAAEPDYSKMPTEQLIDSLTSLDAPAPGIAGFGNFSAFMAEDKPPRFTVGAIGAPTPSVPPQVRELVRRGLQALPLLVGHLEDKRPTRLAVGDAKAVAEGGYFMWQVFQEEYHPRNLTAKPPSCVDDCLLRRPFTGQYVVKVGDVCFVLVGQIVNRGLNAVRYQPTAGLIVNSPVETPSLAEQVRKDWKKLDAKAHEASLLADVRSVEKRYHPHALARLRFYCPNAYNALEGDDLRKRLEFEAEERKGSL